jgi:flagellar basal body-associated protein FliL
MSDDLFDEGSKLVLKRQYKEALAVFNLVVEKHPDNDQAWVAKGVVHTHLKDYRKAYNAFGEALNINPGNQKAKDNQAIVTKYLNMEPPTESGNQPRPSHNVPKSISKNIFWVIVVIFLIVGLVAIIFLSSAMFLTSNSIPNIPVVSSPAVVTTITVIPTYASNTQPVPTIISNIVNKYNRGQVIMVKLPNMDTFTVAIVEVDNPAKRYQVQQILKDTSGQGYHSAGNGTFPVSFDAFDSAVIQVLPITVDPDHLSN